MGSALCAIFVLAAGGGLWGGTKAPVSPGDKLRLEESYGRLPLEFEANQGQWDPRIRFLSRGSGYALYLSGNQAVIALGRGGRRSVIRMNFKGSTGVAEPRGADPLPGVSNYFLGSDPSRWRAAAPHFGRVRYSGVFPGVDLVFYGNQRRLEYDLIVAAGADPGAIQLSFTGAGRLRLDKSGNLLLETPAGVMTQRAPVIYQEIGARRVPVRGRYVLRGNRVGFHVAKYDARRPLVIDPVLVYSTFLGGINLDLGSGIAVDSTGAAYVTGQTFSADFPAQAGYSGTTAGGADVFVTKLSTAGNTLIYSTYLGGTGTEFPAGIAVDATGAYVAGYTTSTDFPVASAFHANNAGQTEVFVTKLNPDGNALLYSTYIGGSGDEQATGISVDSAGAAYVSGFTNSVNYPTTAGALRTSFGGGLSDGFVTKLMPNGLALGYSTYLGGAGEDRAQGIAATADGFAYVTGFTNSNNFPTLGAIRSTPLGGFDVFVTRLVTDGSLSYSTYLGGAADDRANAIAVDSTGAAYITGWTYSTDFPVISGFSNVFGGVYDAFVTKLTEPGNALAYSSYLGGDGEDFGRSIAVDANFNAFVTGDTSSTNFPLAATSPALYNGRPQGAFVTKVAPAGTSLTSSTYLGGSPTDSGYAIAVDSTGAAYVTGATQSLDFPTQNPYSGAVTGFVDVFVAKLVDGVPITTTITTNPAGLNLTIDGITLPGPRYFAWTPASTHTLTALSPQGASPVRQLFTSWSNGGSQTQTVSAPAANTTFTANYAAQNLLSLSVLPAAAGSISATPVSADGFYASSATVQLSATPVAGYAFQGFSGDVNGTANPAPVSMAAPRSVLATFTCAYSLSSSSLSVASDGGRGNVTVNTGGTCNYAAASGAEWIVITSAPGLGTSAVAFSVAANPSANPRSGTISVTAPGAFLTFTVNQAGIPPTSVTIATNPAGLQIMVDGVSSVAPQSFQFTPGTQHSIAVQATQTAAGARHAFLNWSDAGAITHTITAPQTSVTVTASFATSYLLTANISPPGAGAITLSPVSADSYFAAGSAVQLTAVPNSGVTFASWSGDLAGSANPQTLTMNGPRNATATFIPTACGTNYQLSNQQFTAEAAGGTFSVNITTGPGCFWPAAVAGSFVNPFITIGNTVGVGNGTIQFTVLPNTGEFPRSGSFNISGQLVQVLQHATNPAQIFADVSLAHPYLDYISLLKRFNITSGCTSTDYCPESAITRGQMAVFLIRYTSGDAFTDYTPTPYFTDVPASHPYFKYIQKMRDLNITTGCTATGFCPDATVTRGQMAVFLVRTRPNTSTAPGQFSPTPYFNDVPANHPYFASIQKMKELGITSGCSATDYCPDDPNTRGQMAVFIIRGLFTP